MNATGRPRRRRSKALTGLWNPTGHLVRAGLEKAGVDKDVATGIGFGAAVATGAALGTLIPIPGVGTAAGAGIGGLGAGALYPFSLFCGEDGVGGIISGTSRTRT